MKKVVYFEDGWTVRNRLTEAERERFDRLLLQWAPGQWQEYTDLLYLGRVRIPTLIILKEEEEGYEEYEVMWGGYWEGGELSVYEAFGVQKDEEMEEKVAEALGKGDKKKFLELLREWGGEFGDPDAVELEDGIFIYPVLWYLEEERWQEIPDWVLAEWAYEGRVAVKIIKEAETKEWIDI